MSVTHQPAGSRHASAVTTEGDNVADTEIARVLAVALAIGADAKLRETLRGLAGAAAGAPFGVSQPDSNVWLTVDGIRVVAGRGRPKGIATVEQKALSVHADVVMRALRTALAQTTALAESAKLVSPLLAPAEAPSRQDFAALLPWAPAIEQVAYKTAASLAVTLDLLRPHLVPALHAGTRLRPGLLATYWQRLHAMAQCALFASDKAARPWLGDIARQFDWMSWTPTFVLLRERTTWLAACAARSAVAFGEPVVENYLATLGSAKHPFKVFDALFGLAAIALGNTDLAATIGMEVRLLRRLVESREELKSPYIRHVYEDALQVIEGTADWAGHDADEIAALGWRAGSPAGLATDLAFRTDPAIITQSSHVLGFVMLPTVVATPADLFNPDQSLCEAGAGPARQEAMDDKIVAGVVRNAWSAPSQTTRLLH